MKNIIYLLLQIELSAVFVSVCSWTEIGGSLRLHGAIEDQRTLTTYTAPGKWDCL